MIEISLEKNFKEDILEVLLKKVEKDTRHITVDFAKEETELKIQHSPNIERSIEVSQNRGADVEIRIVPKEMGERSAEFFNKAPKESAEIIPEYLEKIQFGA